MPEFQKQGICHICKAERLVTKWKGRWYCWMDLIEQKDYNNVDYIEKGYKKFHKLVGKFRSAE